MRSGEQFGVGARHSGCGLRRRSRETTLEPMAGSVRRLPTRAVTPMFMTASSLCDLSMASSETGLMNGSRKTWLASR